MHKITLDVPGERITEYAAVDARSTHLASGSGDAHAYLVHFEPGGSIGVHVAGFDQVFFVLNGSAWVRVDDETVELHANEAAVIKRGETHAKGSESGARVLMIQLSELR